MSLGAGLSKLSGKVFRIGHLGDLNDLTLVGTLAGVEMGLAIADIRHRSRGVKAAMDYLVSTCHASSERVSAKPDALSLKALQLP